MRLLLILCALVSSSAALAGPADTVKKYRFDCVFPDKVTEVVEAPDDAAAREICRNLWQKAKRAGRHSTGVKTGPGLDDDLFSRRSAD